MLKKVLKVGNRIKSYCILNKMKKSVVRNFLHTPASVLINSIGKNVYLGKEVNIEGDIKDFSIDDYTYIMGGYLYDGVHIGRYCSVAYQVCIGPGEHYTNRLSTYPIQIRTLHTAQNRDEVFPKCLQTIIGNDVWIGNGATNNFSGLA